LSKDIYVPLTGGLGNQIFQLNAALTIARGGSVYVDRSLGRPRIDSRLLPEIENFTWPSNVTFLNLRKANSFQTKTFGYLLRSGVSPRGYEKNPIIGKTIRVLGSLVLSLRFGTYLPISINQGVGFDENFRVRGSSSLIIGYFQTARFTQIPEVKNVQDGIKVNNNLDLVEKYRKLSEVENPLIVHYRLGDYKFETDFGIPDSHYYETSISELWESGKYKSIWVFSDEISAVKNAFPGKLLKFARWIDDLDEYPSQTLEVMRLGSGYVIANSTFSWWGACLSVSPTPAVIAPEPWFKSALEPHELIPPNWKRKPAWSAE